MCGDLRNANPGRSSGPLEIDRPWDAYTDDQLGLMDHLGIREFLVMGFCIGGPLIHNLIRRAPERVVAAAMDAAQRLPARDPRPVLPEQHQGLGAGAVREAPRRHAGHGPRLPHQHVHQARRLRVHRVARFRALHPDAAAHRA
ncbi:MAG TPA: alpha/beta fold hydrolase [Methylomirabilota bacterium]|nr:alpha/beta fold hydrolase [Methylomirabilota bacterium]